MTALAFGWKRLPDWIIRDALITKTGGLVRVPYLNADGTEHNAKLVARKRSWWETADLELIPYGLDTLCPLDQAPGWSLLLSEGESDTLMLRAWRWEKRYDVLGVAGSSLWRPSWLRFPLRYGSVYVLGDGDEAGRKFNLAVLSQLPTARVVRFPPGDDARSVLQRRDGYLEFDELLDQADRLAEFEHELQGMPAVKPKRRVWW